MSVMNSLNENGVIYRDSWEHEDSRANFAANFPRASAANRNATRFLPRWLISFVFALGFLAVFVSTVNGSTRDFCAELMNFTSFECPPRMVCTRGLSDFDSHFSVFDESEWSGLGPEYFQLHYNRYPTIGSSQLLGILAQDEQSKELLFVGSTHPPTGARQFISFPHGYREVINSEGLVGESRTFFVGMDAVMVWVRFRNTGDVTRRIRPTIIGRLGDLPPPDTHLKPGGSKPGPNPLPPFPEGSLGPGTNVLFDKASSILLATRYMDLPRADSGRLMFAVRLPYGWKAGIRNLSGFQYTPIGQNGASNATNAYTPGSPASYELTGPDETLTPNRETDFAIVIAFGLLHHFGVNYVDQLVARAKSYETMRVSPSRAWAQARNRWNRFFSALPQPRFHLPNGDRLYWLSFYTLKRNLYAPDWNFHYKALFETKGWYDAVWQWSIAPFGQLALLQLNPSLAEDQTYFFTENALPTGMIPEHVFNTFVPTDTIHPQLLAYGAWLIFLHTHDLSFLARVYGPLARHVDWLYSGGMDTAGNIRDKDRDSIFEWGSEPWDDGLDNDVRSDPGLDKFEAVDLNAYVLLTEKCLIRMAEALRLESEAARWEARARQLSSGIIQRFYDPKSNMFWDCYYDTHRPFKVLAFYNFLPLLAGVPLPQGQRELMIREYLLNPKNFWGTLPFPSLAFSDPHYSPTNYMRGPVWPAPAVLLIMTLWKNGFHKEADLAAQRFLDAVGRANDIFENYNSRTGDPLYGKRVEMISWNAACVIDLCLQLYRIDDKLNSGFEAPSRSQRADDFLDVNGSSYEISVTGDNIRQ